MASTLFPHSSRCSSTPRIDTRGGRTRYDSPNIRHVCEHVAADIHSRVTFIEGTICDSGAIDELRIACRDCELREESGAPLSGDRWLACSDCATELSRQRGWSGADEVAPYYVERKDFNTWYRRVREIIPNVPEVIAKEWVHRHWGQSAFSFLPLLKMRFAEHSWATQAFAAVSYGRRAAGKPRLYELPSASWLSSYMIERGTWPVPIIVLDNARSGIDGLGELQLLEGHRRYSYLHRLVEAGKAVNSQHKVHLVEIPR